MRERERERFRKLGFSEGELFLINELKKVNKKKAKFKIILTGEYCRMRNGEYQYWSREFYEEVDLMHFADYPEDGRYFDTLYFDYLRQLEEIMSMYEGKFYQLFLNSTGELIGSGMLDPDSPVEEIREYGNVECIHVCDYCWWNSLLYDEIIEDGEFGKCHNPKKN